MDNTTTLIAGTPIAESVAERPDPTDASPAETAVEQELLADELLVEEISIDGMCGVY